MMSQINNLASLEAEIFRLETKQAGEGLDLKAHFLVAYDSVKPINLIMNAMKDITASRDVRSNLLNTSVGLVTGYISKLLFEHGTRNPVKRVLGNALMIGIANLVNKHPEVISSAGKGILKIIRKSPAGKHLPE
jgi:hypothetical protein